MKNLWLVRFFSEWKVRWTVER